MWLTDMEKLFLIAYQLTHNVSYSTFLTRLETMRATQILENVWAIRTLRSAKMLKQELCDLLADQDGLLIVEAGPEWASRRAKTRLGDLVAPPTVPGASNQEVRTRATLNRR